MIIEKIDKAIEILQAFKEGKTIECQKPYETTWEKYLDGEDFLMHNLSTYHWRIAKEPQYRPYANAEEFLKASKEHGPWIKKHCSNTTYLCPVGFINDSIKICNIPQCTCEIISLQYLCNHYDWQDGTPCGILE